MKKSIVSALVIVFLLCLSPIVMAGGGPPSPNTATQPVNGSESDGSGWDIPDLISPGDLGFGEESIEIDNENEFSINILPNLISVFVFPGLSIQQPSEEMNGHEKNIRRISAKRR